MKNPLHPDFFLDSRDASKKVLVKNILKKLRNNFFNILFL